jgi:hypothetical protein
VWQPYLPFTNTVNPRENGFLSDGWVKESVTTVGATSKGITG